jgi:VIT1/CCC1 family predicted Fe2+/Mn2+ transporter
VNLQPNQNRIVARHIHRTHRSGLLRAGVLGANDGVLSISSLMLGVAAAHVSPDAIVISGLAGLVAGALSMGAGEYVSVSSQADTERADLEIERSALGQDYAAEHAELRDIYIRRGLDPELAAQVAEQLMAHDALGAHARDDIGITEALTARPLQAAAASSVSFALGGIVPLLVGIIAPEETQIPVIATISLVLLIALGAFAARAGGAPIFRGAARVLIWGAFAMGVTGALGTLFHAAP